MSQRCDAIARDGRETCNKVVVGVFQRRESGLNHLFEAIIGAREIGHQAQFASEPITGVSSPLRLHCTAGMRACLPTTIHKQTMARLLPPSPGKQS